MRIQYDSRVINAKVQSYQAVEKVLKAISFLTGKGKVVGRQKP